MGDALPDARGEVDPAEGGSDFIQALIDQACVGEAEVFDFPDDDLVDEADAEDLPGLHHAGRALAVLAAGRRITTNMIKE